MNPYAQVPSSIIEENIKKTLFNNAMKGNWEEVISIYQQYGRIAHIAKISRSGDTAIHIAITGGLEEVVERLVSIASAYPDSLEIKNELGNTPLHLAASLGNVRMCKCIATQDSKLIGIRNKDYETPFYVAVHHGRKAAFLCLHYFCQNGEGYAYSRKNDGETILHSAISGEYFDIAFQIIHYYPELLNSVNELGFSPLHLLASKPSAFRSGSHIRGFRKLIYHCIFVDELELESDYPSLSEELQYGDDKTYPESYQTCVGFVLLLRNTIRMLMGYSTNQNRQQPDAEYPRVQKQQADAEAQQTDHKQGESANGQGSSTSGAQGHRFFPPNYLTCFNGLKLLLKAMRVILGLGSMEILNVQEKKEKHIWSVQIMEILLQHASSYEYEDNGKRPLHLRPQQEDGETTPYPLFDGGAIAFSPESFIEPPPVHDDQNLSLPAHNSVNSKQDNKDNGTKETRLEMEMRETPLLIAAKNGITEMVERILELFPVAIHDENSKKRNIVLLAVENRQPGIYKLLFKWKLMKEAIFRQTDSDGNSALHLAATHSNRQPWFIPGPALQMQWEFHWYEFVKDSMPRHFFPRYNNKWETPRVIFTETHKGLVKEGGEWLTRTSESCSVVAGLVATLAFTTFSTVPGGVNQDSGIPILENQPTFSVFAMSSLVSLCFSVLSILMFLGIRTSRLREKDFAVDLPRNLRAGMTFLFLSITSMMVSFCAGHFFVLKNQLEYAAVPMYAATCCVVVVFSIRQFSLYFELLFSAFREEPQRRSK